jgi:hypothetical protein
MKMSTTSTLSYYPIRVRSFQQEYRDVDISDLPRSTLPSKGVFGLRESDLSLVNLQVTDRRPCPNAECLTHDR